MEIIVAFIGFVGVMLGAFMVKLSNNRNNYMQYITNERKLWRDEIRRLTLKMYDKEVNYSALKAEFEIRLNPEDDNDKKILGHLDSLINENKEYMDIRGGIEVKEDPRDEIVKMISRLLKHDWERVKIEANIFGIKPIPFLYTIVYIMLWSGNLGQIISSAHIGVWDITYYLFSGIIIYVIGCYWISHMLKYLERENYCKWLFELFKIPLRMNERNNKNCKESVMGCDENQGMEPTEQTKDTIK